MDNTYVIFTSVDRDEFMARFNDGSYVRFFAGDYISQSDAIAYGNGTEGVYISGRHNIEVFAGDRQGRETYESLAEKHNKDWRFFRAMNHAHDCVVNLPEFRAWQRGDT